MTTLAEIEKAISKLPKQEIRKFRKKFIYQDNENWDAEIENDINSGLLNHLGQEAIKDFESGKCKKV